ncbi:hypothetical protein VTL71DRAFT_4209 [Oculimacula yallundae]|uniref:Uncharacterized protein n=1 Tax=Oculimacula yallundae TaxID=86028 RepID=A0ABR4C576_9HELO
MTREESMMSNWSNQAVHGDSISSRRDDRERERERKELREQERRLEREIAAARARARAREAERNASTRKTNDSRDYS